MFSIYTKVITALGYDTVYSVEDFDNVSIDELSGMIATTDSEADVYGFLTECDIIDDTIRELGYTI